MKKILFGFLFGAVLLGITACITPNPDHTPGAPAYVADTAKITAAQQTAQALNAASAPYNPYTAPGALVIDAIAGLVVAASTIYGKTKGTQAATSAAALDTMSLGVVAAGPAAVQKVTEVASSTPHVGIIANALNENTP